MSNPDNPQEIDELDFWSFSAYAQAHIAEHWPGIDADASHFIMSLNRATDVIFFDARQTGEEYRLSTAGQRILFVLSLCGPLPMLRLAELSGMSKAATWSAVRTLVAEGHVTRTRSKKDGRSNVVTITDEGRQIYDRAFRARNEREVMWASVLTPEEHAQLDGMLDKLMRFAGTHAHRRDSLS